MDFELYVGLAQVGVVFLTGLFAFAIYALKRRSELKSVAVMLCLEINRIEEAMTQIHVEGGKTLIGGLNKTDLWENNKQYFVGELTHSEYKALDDFFGFSRMISSLIDEHNKFHKDAYYHRAMGLQEAILSLANFCITYGYEDDYGNFKDKLLEYAHAENYWYVPTYVTQSFERYLPVFKFYGGTTGYEKIRRMAKFK